MFTGIISGYQPLTPRFSLLQIFNPSKTFMGIKERKSINLSGYGLKVRAISSFETLYS